jgi:subtilase family serine protease
MDEGGMDMVGTRTPRAGRRLRSVAMVLPVVFALWSAGAASAATSATTRVGSPAPLPPGTQTVGRTASSTRLRMAVVLAPQPGLAAYASAVSAPGSALYGRFLGVAQFARRFGATPAQVAAVSSTLRAAGLEVGSVSANQLVIPVTGTAAQVEKAFSLSLAKVKLSSGRVAYANEQAPALPSSIASYVQGVVGLSDVARYEPAQLRKPNPKQRLAAPRARKAGPSVATGGPQPCSSAVAGQAHGGLTADEVASAYGFSGLYGIGARGNGQTIAMFEQQPYDPTDIAFYQACYGTHVPVSNVNVDGGPGPYEPPPGGGDGESSLDIEQAIGLAPNARILVYQGPFTVPLTATVDIINAIVSQNRAKVISSSYGLCETLTGTTIARAENTLLQEAAIQGQSFFISSGDSGSAQCFQADQGNPAKSVLDPAGQPFATGVGGTTVFTRGPNCPALNCYWAPGNPLFESVWNDGFDVQSNRASATGGGISEFWSMPTYQSQTPASLGVESQYSSGVPCNIVGFCREVPDIAANADPNTGYIVFSDGAWTITGGTSASAPLWASFMALTNSQAACQGLPIGFVNPALYGIAGSHFPTYFKDVTLSSPFTGAPGNDAIGTNQGLFPVLPGYDMTTGLGSMLAPKLASVLCALRVPPPTATTAGATGITGTSATIHGIINPRGVTTQFRFDVGRTRRYGASSSPSSVGRGTRNVSVSASVTHLAFNTTYHYRVVALRGGRVVAVGGDRTFKTKRKR